MADETQSKGGITEFLQSKVLGPLTSFAVMGVVVWNIQMNSRMAIMEDHEQTIFRLKDELINKQSAKADRIEMELIDIKVEMAALRATMHDIARYKDDNLIEQDKQKK